MGYTLNTITVCDKNVTHIYTQVLHINVSVKSPNGHIVMLKRGDWKALVCALSFQYPLYTVQTIWSP